MSRQNISLAILASISCSVAFAAGSTFQLTGTYFGPSGTDITPFQGPNFTLTFTLPDEITSGGQGGLYPYYTWSGNIQYTDNGTTVYPTGAVLTFFPNPCWENCTVIGGFILSVSNLYVPGDTLTFYLNGPMLFSPNNAMPIFPSGSYQLYTSGSGAPRYGYGANYGTTAIGGVQVTVTTPQSTVLTVSSLSPWSVFAGNPALTLAVNGTGFLSGASVLWNGSPLSTVFLGGTQVNASVPANLLAAPGGNSVSVSNPGGAVSASVQFLVNPAVSLTILTPSQLPSATKGSFYTQTLMVSGSAPPYAWTLVSETLPPGLSFSSGVVSGIPTATGSFTFTAHVTDPYSATATGTFTLSVVAAPCFYSLDPAGQTFPSAGGFESVAVATSAGCTWSVAGVPAWVTILSGDSGSGNGSLRYAAAPNTTSVARSAAISIGGRSFVVQQPGLTSLTVIGSAPHLAADENWTTTFTLVNQSSTSATALLSFFGDAADPTGDNPLLLPLIFPQQSSTSEPQMKAWFEQQLSSNASLIATTAGPQTPPVLVGSAQLSATGPVDGFAIFHQIVTAQEAVVPLESRIAGSYLLAFDNAGGATLGVAVENVSRQNATIPVTVRDDSGNLIAESSSTISLGGNGHTSFVLSDKYPNTAGRRGTIEFDTPAGGQLSVLGLRFTPPNNALTTIPALANVGAGGGSIAHLASGGDGWQTTFVLVNAGTSATSTTLNFYADITGDPMPLPLSFPQIGTGSIILVPSYTAQLPAGASLIIVSNNDGQPLLAGSAQLTTPGHVSGFVIFRHNNQEAVVPLESRNASAYVIAFDNTNGTATGIALNAVSAQQVKIPVTVRDDRGMPIATDTITLAANGHYAFTLGSDKYPAAASIRGTIEFDKPAGAQIGALGIRIPAVAAHTYTTLPALAK